MTKFMMAVAAAAMAMMAQSAAALTTFNFSFSGTIAETQQAFSSNGIFTIDETQSVGLPEGTAFLVDTIMGSINLGGTVFDIDGLTDVLPTGEATANFVIDNGTNFELGFLAVNFNTTDIAVFTLDQASLAVGPAGNQTDLTVDPLQVSIAAVPEPATWGLMLAGFAMVGATMRRRRVSVRFA